MAPRPRNPAVLGGFAFALFPGRSGPASGSGHVLNMAPFPLDTAARLRTSLGHRIVKGNAMNKLIGAAAGLLILVGTVGSGAPALLADSSERYSGSVSASSWDWPK